MADSLSIITPLKNHEVYSKQAELPASLPEIHGLLCGLICSGPRLNGSYWLHHLLMRFRSDFHQKQVLELYEVTCQQFIQQENTFQLLLSEDGTDTLQLKSALHTWCLNFLKGLSLSAETYPLPISMSTAVLDSLYNIIHVAQRKLNQWKIEEDSNTLEKLKHAISNAIPIIYQTFSQAYQGTVMEIHALH